MSVKRVLTITGMVIAGILILVAAFTSWFTVEESEQSVLITFGVAGEVNTEPGLHFKLPWPLQKVEVLSKETYSLQFGYKQNPDGTIDETYPEETKMITGDENIVLTDLVVQWKIVDPKKYLFNAENPRQLLHDATSASIRSVIGNSTIDDALTSGKAEIEVHTRDLLATLIEKYDIGVSVLSVKLQDVELPNQEVRAAFTAVTDAQETKSTKINQAGKYQNQRESEAIGEVKAIMEKAEGERIARIEQARGDVAVFNKLYEEYRNHKEITRQRLVIETLEQILPNAQIYIMNDSGETMKYLPLGQMQQVVPPAESKESTEGGGN